MNESIPKPPHPIDVHVGSRVRLRRMMLGLSQSKLADSLGIAFQQVQKYEKGTNRIGAGRLWDISRALDVPVSFFYEDLNSAGVPPYSDDGASEPERKKIYYPPEDVSRLTNFMSSREGYQLMSAFSRIKSASARKGLVALVRALAGEADESDEVDSTD